jgi:hypothetical protein
MKIKMGIGFSDDLLSKDCLNLLPLAVIDGFTVSIHPHTWVENIGGKITLPP